MFEEAADGNINKSSVMSYVIKHPHNSVPKATICIYPNQKPLVSLKICTKLGPQPATPIKLAYKAVRYELQKSIEDSKRDFWARVELDLNWQ